MFRHRRVSLAAIVLGLALDLLAGVSWAQVRESRFTVMSRGKAIGVDVYLPHSQGKHPAVLVLHGNLGMTASRFLSHWGEKLARAGYCAFVVHYFEATGHERASVLAAMNVANQNAWVAAVEDAVTAVAARDDVDGRIGLLGFSLGAFVGTSAASENPRIIAVAEQSGGLFASRFSRASRLPAVLILHGEADSIVPVGIARNLERALKENHREYEIRIYPGDDHALSAHENEASELIMDFLGRRVRVR